MRCPICGRELRAPPTLTEGGGLYKYVELHKHPRPHALLVLADEEGQIRRVRETDSLDGSRVVIVIDDEGAEQIELPQIRLPPHIERSVIAHLKGSVDGVDPAALQLVALARRTKLWGSSSGRS